MISTGLILIAFWTAFLVGARLIGGAHNCKELTFEEHMAKFDKDCNE